MKIVQNRTTSYLSANFTEDETQWLIGSLFNYTDEIRDGHYIYKYAGADGTNTTDSPAVNSLTITPSWVKIKPTNYYAMIDGETGTQTENAETITISITGINYDSFSLLEVVGTTIDIELYDNSTSAVVFEKTFDLQDESSIIDFFTYCFSEFTFTPSIYTDAIPLYTDAKLTITISNAGSIAKCGRLVFGRSSYIGDTGYGANLGIESYSRKVVDEFGNTTLVHRGSVNLDSYEVQVPTQKIPLLKRKAQELDAIPILFVMDESPTSNTENLLNFGYWHSFSMLIPNSVKSSISLTIKGIL